jgi:uncharacterized protein (DUF2252 family)
MAQSPFAFLRGAAAILAFDLSRTPATGIQVQACGDCHLLNFGVFATPERALVFDIDDFDETLPAPWEWDLKHLAISVVVAGRHLRRSDEKAREIATACVRSYREHLLEYAKIPALEIWYARLDLNELLRLSSTKEARKRWQKEADHARSHTGEHALAHLTEMVHGHRRIVDHRPFIYHPSKHQSFERDLQSFFELYRQSLPDERRVLLDRYHLADLAMKVVGVGSVGTRCAVALLEEDENKSPLLMQFKEARPSVLEPYAGRSAYTNQGQRVVAGQRLMQAASDILLGWSRVESKRRPIDFYFRQLRDMKWSVNLDSMTASAFDDYAQLCGWALARAHAKSGDAASISGYVGKAITFDRAVATFALAYAAQVESDHKQLVAAVKSGRIKAATS